MKTDVILVGGFHEIIELCEDCGHHIVGIIDNDLIGNYCGYPVIGKDYDAEALFMKYGKAKIIITPDLPKLRKQLVEYYQSIGYSFITVISPHARVSRSATIGEGTVVQAGVNISSATVIGNFCKLNTNCNIMHDNIVRDYATIAPNAVLLGRVSVGKGAYIGANSTLLPNICVGDNAVVGAGAVATRNVTNNAIVKGVPAK